jgi:hypothetical protein
MEDHPAEQTVERNGLETPVAGAPSNPFSTILGWSPADKQIVLLVLALKVLVLYLAVLSVGTLFDQYESWRTLWNRWDATHYLSLAENGYTDTGEGRFSIVFYPLYPFHEKVFKLRFEFICLRRLGSCFHADSGVLSVQI